MRKVVSYGIARGNDIDALEDSINEEIEDGLQPFGGVSCIIENGKVYYVQAMVKYEDEEAGNIKLQQAHMMEKFKMIEKIKAKDLKHEDEA